MRFLSLLSWRGDDLSGEALKRSPHPAEGYGDRHQPQLDLSDKLPGQPEKWLYDDAGNVTEHWAMITNSRGDVCELLDSGGNAFAAYHYDAWGLPQGSGNYATGIWTQSTSLITSTLAGQIASEQVLRYASYVYDPESGLYYCSARYYDATTRQWTTADSAKADGEESAYQYCAGEPIRDSDPSGQRAIFRKYHDVPLSFHFSLPSHHVDWHDQPHPPHDSWPQWPLIPWIRGWDPLPDLVPIETHHYYFHWHRW